jgi:hypothetical protein
MSTDKQCDCDACAVVFRLAGPDVGASGDDDILDRLRHQWNGEYDPTGRLLSEAADEIERLRAEVDDLKRINMNLRYLIPEAVWMDEADRLRGDNQESPANEIERLRSLITAWADAWDEQGADVQGQGSYHDVTVRRIDTGDALRKAVGR